MYKENQARILLLYVSDVSGHRQAARAIKQAFQQKYPRVTVREENLFHHGNSFIRCSLDSLYYTMIKLTPWLWDIIWDSMEVYWLTYLLRSLLYRMNYHRLYRKVIKPFNPEAIVCTHSLCCAICSTIKQDKDLDYLLIAVPTDFYLNPYWFYKNVDMYFLPRNGLNLGPIRWKIPPDKFQITGIPVSPEFLKNKDKKHLKKKWQVEDDRFTVLIMGGGQGLGAIKDTVLALKKISFPLQVLVVTGTNRTLKKNLHKLTSRLNFPLKVLGYVRQIDELMEISDLLISKPGGLTTAEALSKGIPMIVVDSIAGQERRNKKLLLEKGLAFDLEKTEDLSSFIHRFFNNSFNRKTWMEKTKKLARPEASYEIAIKVMDMIVTKKRGKNK